MKDLTPNLDALDAQIELTEQVTVYHIEHDNNQETRQRLFETLDDQYRDVGWRIRRTGPLPGTPKRGLMVIAVTHPQD